MSEARLARCRAAYQDGPFHGVDWAYGSGSTVCHIPDGETTTPASTSISEFARLFGEYVRRSQERQIAYQEAAKRTTETWEQSPSGGPFVHIKEQ